MPVPVPLLSGVREDLADFGAENPALLQVAENVVFTRKGSVRGRPTQQAHGTQPCTAFMAMSGEVPTTVQGVADLCSVRAGIMERPGAAGQSTVLAAYQGQLLRRSAAFTWHQVGPFWSVRKSESRPLGQVNGYGIHVGNTVVGTKLVYQGVVESAVYLDENGDVKSAVGYAGPSPMVIGCAGDAVFYLTGSTLRMITEAGAVVTIATDANGGQSDAWVVPGDAGHYCLVYRTTTTTTLKVLRITSSGSVTHTLSITVPGTGTSVAIACNGTKAVLLYNEGPSATQVTSKVLNFGAGGISDATLDAAITVPSGNPDGRMTVGIVGGVAYWAVATNDGNCLIGTRELDTTVLAINYTLRSSGAFDYWRPLFPAVSFAGRPVMGVQRYRTASTWFVLDLAEIVDLGVVTVASGTIDGFWGSKAIPPSFLDDTQSNWPGTAVVVGNALRFGVAKGTEFPMNSGKWQVVRVTLTPQPATSRSARGVDLFSGCTPYSFDGVVSWPHGFREGYPLVESASAVAGGSLTADASYSFQAIWSYVDGSGNKVRSMTSQVVTTSTTSSNRQINVNVTVPQVWDLVSVRTPPTVELYITQPNPSSSADLFFFGAKTGVPGTDSYVQFTVTADVNVQTSAALYTGGDVLDDEAPPAGDRGIAFAAGRLWVADARRVYASKLLKPLISPAWSTNDTHVVEVPSDLGEVEGLLGQGDRVLVLGSAGIMAVWGNGYDDTGLTGSPFQTQVIARIGHVGGPRAACELPQGGAFLGVDGGIYLVNGWDVTKISDPVRLHGFGVTPVDLCFAQAGTAGLETPTNPMLVAGGSPMRVLDLTAGQWAVWTHSNVEYLAAVDGVLWAQCNTADEIVSYTGTNGQDVATNVVQKVRTGILRPGNSNLSWGRVRGVGVVGKILGNHDLRVRVLGDDKQVVMADQTLSRTDSDVTQIPQGHAPEVRTTSQRCGFVTVELTATPALAEWTTIDVWASTSSERAPARSRS